jgi:ribosomal protein L18E
VLADGILDKELRIYANDFSLSAVKMIALLGGEAVKVSTVRVKMPVNPDE